MNKRRFKDCAILLHPSDTVAVLKQPLGAGTVLTDGQAELAVSTDIPAGHKMAVREVQEGAPVRKYGQIIGFACRPIAPGDHVHSHNLVAKEFDRDVRLGCPPPPLIRYPAEQMRFFDGYARPGGRAGTRNYLGIISSVNCSASVARLVQTRFQTEDLRREFPNVDGLAVFTHKTGCGIQPGGPQEQVERVLAGIAAHPNLAGCVLLGLGCEVIHLRGLRDRHRLGRAGDAALEPVFLEIQSLGGAGKTVEAAVKAVAGMLPLANALRRTRLPISQLILATNCGGSDGNSGITANPALGVAGDELVRYGGTSVLAETPEIYGAEHLLAERAATPEIGRKLLSIIAWWEEYARLHGATIDNNPSSGNKAGGLTTIYEKSLGAVAKGGQSPLAAVYRYAEPITAPGFCFMDTPGLDPVSMTGLVAGGCNLGVFTTGRGSVYGCKPTPCIKVATNSALFERMRDDMDIDAGTILDGSETVTQVGQRIFEKMLAVASGEKTKSELAGFGDEEFAPWVLGPTF